MSDTAIREPRVVVVGAGPAGVRATQALVQAGLRPVVIDEGRRDGGQIYRRQPEGFKRSYAKLYGSEAAKAQALHRDFDALRAQVDYRSDTLAWNLSEGELHVVHAGEPQTLPFDALLVCSGATDRLMPVPGWQRAGCYSLGASQIALKAQACAIGARVVFLGSGPLLYLVASQYVQAGAQVAAVLDTAPAAKSWAAVAGLLARPGLALRGLALIRSLRRARVPVLQGVTAPRIDGDGSIGVQSVAVCDSNGREQRFECDAVGLGWHLRAETQLADLARCEFEFEPASRQWLPRIDADGRSSTRGVYLAGDGARILGADGAEAAGRLAALAALADLGHVQGRALYESESAGLRRTLAQMDRFRKGLAQRLSVAARAGRRIARRRGGVPLRSRHRRRTAALRRRAGQPRSQPRQGVQPRRHGSLPRTLLRPRVGRDRGAGLWRARGTGGPPAHAGPRQAADDEHARGAGMRDAATHDTAMCWCWAEA